MNHKMELAMDGGLEETPSPCYEEGSLGGAEEITPFFNYRILTLIPSAHPH